MPKTIPPIDPAIAMEIILHAERLCDTMLDGNVCFTGEHARKVRHLAGRLQGFIREARIDHRAQIEQGADL